MIDEPINQYAHVERRATYPCGSHDRRIAVTEQSVQTMERTMEGVSTKLDLILAQITKIAVLEQRHNTQELDITRAHDKIGKLEEKHDELAVEIREFMNYSKGVTKMMWAIASVVGALLIKVLFFASANGMTP